MDNNEVIMKGNEALAEAAIRVGCRFFSGYPITPQTEILEYMSWRMDEVGGEAIQTEDELAGINMVLGASAAGARALTSSAGPGFSLKQEGISYLVAADLPAVIVDVARIGNGLGDISQSQSDYHLVTKGNGHGDTMVIALTPATVQETADFVALAFELAEKYRHPVIILSDAAIGQMMEGVALPEMKEHDINKFDWTVKGHKKGDPVRKIVNTSYICEGDFVGYESILRNKYNQIKKEEQRWENVEVSDAEVVIVAYGISSRVAKEAVKVARKQGIKLGLIRPQTITPFPVKAFDEISKDCKGIMIVEMSIMGQLKDDVKLATKCTLPIYGYLTSYIVPDSEKIIALAKDILAGKAKEVV
jgi:2-oxoglutarate ferredoxin oxidoreductase subunit alpha